MWNVCVVTVPLLIGFLESVSTCLQKFEYFLQNTGAQTTEECLAQILPHSKTVCD